MKYVMIEVSLGGEVAKLVPIIFPDFMTHVDIAKAGTEILANIHRLNDVRVVSAGDIDLSLVECSGSSETLKTESNEEDAKVINSYDYVHGIGWSSRGSIG